MRVHSGAGAWQMRVAAIAFLMRTRRHIGDGRIVSRALYVRLVRLPFMMMMGGDGDRAAQEMHVPRRRREGEQTRQQGEAEQGAKSGEHPEHDRTLRPFGKGGKAVVTP